MARAPPSTTTPVRCAVNCHPAVSGGPLMRHALTILILFLPVGVYGQNAATNPLDPLAFPRLKTFGAYRTSSNNLYVDSNDDCKHPIPGETVVLADLQG